MDWMDEKERQVETQHESDWWSVVTNTEYSVIQTLSSLLSASSITQRDRSDLALSHSQSQTESQS